MPTIPINDTMQNMDELRAHLRGPFTFQGMQKVPWSDMLHITVIEEDWPQYLARTIAKIINEGAERLFRHGVDREPLAVRYGTESEPDGGRIVRVEIEFAREDTYAEYTNPYVVPLPTFRVPVSGNYASIGTPAYSGSWYSNYSRVVEPVSDSCYRERDTAVPAANPFG